MARTELPVTAGLIAWAIGKSGFSIEEIAESVDVDASQVDAWAQNRAKPSITELRRLATKLHRPFAAFFLPRPPADTDVRVEFRHPPGSHDRVLNHTELRFLRRAQRLQQVLSWIASELNQPEVALPTFEVDRSPIDAAHTARGLLRVSMDDQFAWPTSALAFDGWRESCEQLGILVFLFSLGEGSSRGFSVWDSRAPVIAINTFWNEEARIYTLFHEFGHLLTRTNSACEEGLATSNGDPVERWCERFASGILMPRDAVLRFAAQQRIDRRIRGISDIRWFANRFRVSLRAATIQLIEVGLATWDDYRTLPPTGDRKKGGGGGGGGRDMAEIRIDQLGGRAANMFKRAVDAEVMSRTQALDYLDVTDGHFDTLASGSN